MSSNPVHDRKALLKNALVALDEMQAKLDAVERARKEPIAIVGMSCRFPGGANSPEAYWELLRNGVDAIREFPPERANVQDYAGKDAVWYGGFLDDIDQFDPQFFGISPREASTMDPQQRLVLEVAWEALENAGLAPDQLSGSLTGVFIGVTTNDYAQLVKQSSGLDMDIYSATGTALNVVAGRLAYLLGLQGPCAALDTACSSSLVAIHLACQSLRNGDSDMVITGGVNATLAPENFICFTGWGMMAPDGRCKTFDVSADGFVRGEGCGIIVLKRLSDAMANGDRILAVIRGSAVNEDGHSSGLTVPNGVAQQAVIRRALVNGDVLPAQVSYVETHGTGTTLGDPIEVEAIGAVFADGRQNRPLMLGAVKSNIGHLESASGVAGLIKVVLSMQHGELPPNLHFHERSPRIPWPNFPVVIPTEPILWADQPRVAGVSSFGFSGVNAHVVLAEAPAREFSTSEVERPVHLLTLSAKNESALRQLASRYADTFTSSDVSLADAAYTTNIGRAHLNHRLALAADSPAQAYERLAAFAVGEEAQGITVGQTTGSKPRVAFLFTGQGSQYVGMGRELYETQPSFRAALDECDRLLRPHLDQPLLSVLYPEEGVESPIDHTSYTQPALFALEYALAKLWQSWGIEPSAVMGHSVGEYVAACIAGVFSLEDGLKLIATRGRLMGDLPDDGQMTAVFAAEAAVTEAIAPYADSISIAAVNGPGNTVISGDGEAMRTAVDALNQQGIKTRPLVVSHAFHSPLMNPILDAFEGVARGVHFSRPRIKLLSNVTGQFADEVVQTPQYWRKHIREAVRFGDAVQTLYDKGYTAFVEIGPGSTLLGMGQRCVPEGTDLLWLPSLRKGQGDWEQLVKSLGTLYVHGAEVDWAGFDQDYPRHKLALPTYPFQRKRYWVEASQSQVASSRTGTGHPLLGTELELPGFAEVTTWENLISLKRLPFIGDHQVQHNVIVPATAYLEMAVAASVKTASPLPLAIVGVQNKNPLYLQDDEARRLQVVLRTVEAEEDKFEVYSRPERSQQRVWTQHVSGTVRRLPEQDLEPLVRQFDPRDVMSRCVEEIAGEEFYARLAEKGNQWGPAFQGVEHIWRGNGEALSRVQVPPEVVNDLKNYIIHPAVSDALGHVLIATISLDPSNDSRGGAFVGAGVDESRVYAPISTEVFWCYARLRPNDGSSNLLIGDVAIYDENLSLISETRGARLWYLEDNNLETIPHQLDNWFYGVDWQESKILPVTPTQTGRWLVLADNQGVGEVLASRLRLNTGEAVLVYQGDSFERRADTVFQCRPANADDLAHVMDVAFTEANPCQGIVFLWGLDAPVTDQLNFENLLSSQAAGSETVLSLVQTVTRSLDEDVPRIWLVTQGAQVIGAHEQTQVAQAPLWGLGRALTLEHPSVWGGMIDLEIQTSDEAAAEQIWKVLWQSSREDQFAFREGLSFVPRLTQRNIPAATPVQLTADATYLITGGLGGLGLEVARWMVEKGACRLILIGRTPLPPREEWASLDQDSRPGRRVAAIQHLESLGAQVITVSADSSDVAAMRDFIDQFSTWDWPPIRGVVHAAGVMQYQLMRDQQIEDMRAIFAPKVAGAWLLHDLLRDVPLDFFVLFSSTSALLSSPLMSSYAAANTFLDALAHYRRACGLPALSVNWGTWSESGMATEFNAATVDVSQTLTNEQGLTALERLLHNESAQVAVMPLKWDVWFKQFRAFQDAPFLSNISSRGSSSRSTGAASRPKQTRVASKTKAASIPGFSPAESLVADVWRQVLGLEQFSLQDNFLDIGGDSIMVVETINKIESRTGVRLDPATIYVKNLAQLAASIESSLPASETAPTVEDEIPTTAPAVVTDRETPIYFGKPDEPLYGMYYPPTSGNRDTAVVICPPWGQEFIRAHRACHQLAMRLSNAGYPVLRFDYYGTGDSGGNDGEHNVSQSLHDIETAIDEVRARSRVQQVALVGWRLGAALAALTAARLGDLARVVLWDPIINGGDYLEELGDWHRKTMFYYLADTRPESTVEGTEFLGFAMSDKMVEELRQLDLLGLDGTVSLPVMIIERETQPTTDSLRARLEQLGATTSYSQVDAPQLWTENPDKALVPHQTLQAILTWMMEE